MPPQAPIGLMSFIGWQCDSKEGERIRRAYSCFLTTLRRSVFPAVREDEASVETATLWQAHIYEFVVESRPVCVHRLYA